MRAKSIRRETELQAHEYSVVNHSRTSIGRYLGALAAGFAAASAGVAVVAGGALASVGLPTWGQHLVGASVSASLAYTGIHWLFDKFGWKLTCWAMHFPNIGGTWDCEGETRAEDGTVTFNWHAVVTVTQTWEKIRVHLRTVQSASNSVSAALLPEADGSWMLLYSYRNEPRGGEPAEIRSHLGYCEMRFAPDLRTAEGDYFNARGRRTAGRMTLRRRD